MDDTTFIEEILNELVIQAPVLFVGSLGLLVSMRFWRRAPTASRWCVLAFLLALASSAATMSGSLSESYFLNSVVALYLRGAALAVFLTAVYAGRTNPPAGPAGEQQTLWQPIVELFRARPWLKGLFRTAFVSTFLLVFVWGVLVTFSKPETYVGLAHVRMHMAEVDSTVTNSVETAFMRQMQTECVVIGSQVVLKGVVENPKLNLKERWAAKFNGGEPLTTPEMISLIKNFTNVRLSRKFSVIEIRAYGDKPEEAAELANAIAESYCSYVSAMSGASRAADEDKPQAEVAEIVDRATTNPVPVRPNKPRETLLAFWGAMWIAFVVGLLVVWLSIKFDKYRTPLLGSNTAGGPSQEWVTSQNTLGAALRDQARSSDGLEALRLLDEAASAYRAVLAAGTRDSYPKGWAMAQNNLGVLLRDRAEWSPQDLAVSLLREAAAAHRSALEFYTREQHPHYWATTQNNLGIALRDQAKRSQGPEAARLLNESVAACRAVLET